MHSAFASTQVQNRPQEFCCTWTGGTDSQTVLASQPKSDVQNTDSRWHQPMRAGVEDSPDAPCPARHQPFHCWLVGQSEGLPEAAVTLGSRSRIRELRAVTLHRFTCRVSRF